MLMVLALALLDTYCAGNSHLTFKNTLTFTVAQENGKTESQTMPKEEKKKGRGHVVMKTPCNGSVVGFQDDAAGGGGGGLGAQGGNLFAARNISEGDISIVGLKRRVGLISGTALIVGTMIGSGIFVSPKGVLERSGSIGLSLIVWVGSGLISLLGALCYAELGTLITKAGAEYSYILESFGGILAFLFSWISVFVLKPAMLAIICLTLSEYVVQPFFPDCQPDGSAIKLITVFFIGIICFLGIFCWINFLILIVCT